MKSSEIKDVFFSMLHNIEDNEESISKCCKFIIDNKIKLNNNYDFMFLINKRIDKKEALEKLMNRIHDIDTNIMIYKSFYSDKEFDEDDNKLIEISKKDDLDSFITFCINNEINEKRFKIIVVFYAIKCLKYYLLNNANDLLSKDSISFLGLSIHEDYEMFRILEQHNLINYYSVANECLQLRLNYDLFRYCLSKIDFTLNDPDNVFWRGVLLMNSWQTDNLTSFSILYDYIITFPYHIKRGIIHYNEYNTHDDIIEFLISHKNEKGIVFDNDEIVKLIEQKFSLEYLDKNFDLQIERLVEFLRKHPRLLGYYKQIYNALRFFINKFGLNYIRNNKRCYEAVELCVIDGIELIMKANCLKLTDKEIEKDFRNIFISILKDNIHSDIMYIAKKNNLTENKEYKSLLITFLKECGVNVNE